MTERVSGTLLGLVVAADPSASLRRTAAYDKVHAAAQAAGLREAMAGFDERVRNADAHTDFDVGPDYVVLGRNRARPETVSDDHLVDIVLASLESCAAIAAAIDCVLSEAGHPAGQDRVADLPTQDLLAILLAASGIHPGRVRFKGDRLEVSGAAHGNLGINPLSVIAVLTPYVAPDTRRLIFRLKRSTGTLVADVVLDPLRRSQTEEGLAKDVAFVEFLGRATINGQAVFSRRHARFALTYYLNPFLHAPLMEAEEAGRLLAAAARHLKDRELAEAFDAFIVMKKAQEGGSPAPPGVRRTFERLAEYISKPPGPWNDGSGPKLAAA
jgi:hypothetical protein